jgi:hypothetical protein
MQYQIKVTFESDRALTALELDELIGFLALQVEEPTTHDGDDVEYELSGQLVEIIQGVNNE